MVMLPLLLGLMVATLSPRASAQRGGCVLRYENGALVEASTWTSQVVNLAEGTHAYTPLPDTAPADHAYYAFIDTRNVKHVAIDSTNAKYFQVELTTNTLIIKTGEQFPVFEKVTSIISKIFQLELTVTCGDSDDVNEANLLRVLVRVHDSNNYAPEAESDGYVFRLAVPLPAGTDLTKQQPIAAQDYDVTSQGLLAEVVGGDGAFAAVASKSGSERGSYAVTLSTTAAIRDTRPIHFQIRLQDLGTSDDSQKQEEFVSVTFEPDLDTSMVPPRFEEPLYSFQVESASAGAALGAPLQLTEGAAAALHLRDAFLPDGEASASALLEAVLEEAEGGGGSGGGGVQLQWREDADAEAVAAMLSRRYALLVLTANDADPTLTGSTVIHLALPGPEPDPTTTPEPCPTTVAVTTTECPVCPDTTTAESCPSTGTDATTECPICPDTTTAESCPSTGTDATTECPICPDTTTANDPCPTTDTDACTECPSCPETTTATYTCPTAGSDVTTECPICPDTTTATDPCPSTGTDASTECPICPDTTTAESCPICPDTTTAADPCPTTGSDVTTECPICPDTTTAAEACPSCPETTTSADPCPTAGTDASTVCPACPETTTAADPCPSTGSDASTECPVCPDTSTASPTCPDTSTVTDCSCEPCSATTECPATECPATECPGASTQEPEPAVRLAFEREWYWVHVPADAPEGQELVWPRLTAASAATPGVRFSVDKGASSSPLALVRVDQETGRVTLGLSPPLAGSHLYTLRASAPAAAPAIAELVVTGPASGACGGEGAWCFGAALTVVRVPESQAVQTVLPAAADADRGCRFSLADASTDLLSVDAATGEVTAQPLDREHEAWACADEPVLRLQLHVSCASAAPDAAANASSTHALADADTCPAADWEAALGPSVASDGASTLALVLLQDANDNAPTFDPPRLTLGLPDARAAPLLRPAAIFVAQATDRDAGINAELRYSLTGAGARWVAVHEDTGALYLRAAPAPASAEEAEAEAEVLATDRRGRPDDPGTNTGRLALTLVALSAAQLAEVRVRGALPESAEAVLLSTQAQTEAEGLQLRALSTAFLPADGDRRSRDDDAEGEDAEGELRLVVYALRDGRPLPAQDFQDVLQSALEEAGWAGAAVAPADLGGGSGGGGGGGGGGLVAAVVVLAVLLCLLLVAGGGAAFYLRRRFFAAKEEEPWPKGGKGDPVGDASDSSLRSVVANIEPLTEDLIRTRHTADSSPSLLLEGPAVGHLLPLEPEPPASGLQLWRDGDGDGESSLEEAAPAPPADLEEPSDGPSARKVAFNEDVDCIELRM